MADDEVMLGDMIARIVEEAVEARTADDVDRAVGEAFARAAAMMGVRASRYVRIVREVRDGEG